MKYLIMIYSNPRTWGHPVFLNTEEAEAMTQAERDEMVAGEEALFAEIAESGELVEGQALADPITTRTVRVHNKVPVTTDGPYGEAKEQMAGYFIVDCETPERAVEIAARFPDARFGPVVVRPIMDFSGQDV
ncbi:YciI family protein [Lentzea tibetensis]|uniref:YciI family protein n=1 Tax=Lentzea tibetensis TaxID=2591470 RepID=A0A563F2J9_9PSEU|nr:YciI family protein [Lentzea tibetensis]TWP54185.1 YciI family protein [Lentzea tibetensis]